MTPDKDDTYATELADYVRAEEQQLAETRLHAVGALGAPDQATEPARKAAPVAPSQERQS